MFHHLFAKIYCQPVALHPATFDTIDRQFTAILEKRLIVHPELPQEQLGATLRNLAPYPVPKIRPRAASFKSRAMDDWDPNDPDNDSNGDGVPLYEYNQRTGVGLLRVWGVIGKHLSWLDMACGGCDLQHIDRALDALASEQNLKALVVDFRSPGGGVAGVKETAEKLATFGAPVYAYTEEMCASAAYWLASACRGGIYCAPTATVGSIGVYCAAIDRSAQLEAAGIAVKVFRTGPYKAINLMGRGLSDVESARLQAGVDEVFADFLAAIDAGRNIETYDTDALLGDAWFGSHAPSGVVDAADVPSLRQFLSLVTSMHS